MPDPATMEAAVHEYVAAFESQSAERAVAIFSDDATVEDPVGTPIKRGKEELLEFYTASVATGAKLELLGPIRLAAEYAAFPFAVHLEWEGSRKRIEVIDTFRFNEDGKVVEMRAFFGPGNMHETA